MVRAIKKFDLNGHSKNLTVQIELDDSIEFEDNIPWRAKLNFDTNSSKAFKFDNAAISIQDAELKLKGCLQPGLETIIDRG